MRQSDAIKLQRNIDDGAIWNVFKFYDMNYFEGYANGLQQTKDKSTSESKKKSENDNINLKKDLPKFFTSDMIKQFISKSIDNWRDRPVDGRI